MGMLTKDTNNMPPRTEGTTLGPCVMIAIVLSVFSFIPLLIATVTIRETVEEAKNEMNSEKKEYEREIMRSNLAYGATAGSGAYVQQPDSQYQQQGYLPAQPMETQPNFSGGYQQNYAQGQQQQ